MGGQTILGSDKNAIPMQTSGTSDGIGIFSEIRSECATKLESLNNQKSLIEKTLIASFHIVFVIKYRLSNEIKIE